MGNCSSSSQPAPTGKHAQHLHRIADKFESIEEVQSALRQAGLEASELILAIDLTKSNEWTGRNSFNGQSLHSLQLGMNNPYKSVISIVAKTLEPFDDDNLIPTFGFGESNSKEHSLIAFSRDGKPIHTLGNVLHAYDDLVPQVTLSGPTNFAPAIYKAIEIVEQSGGQYHILVIVADGQVSGGSCMQQTVHAICEASHYPLSIVMVGVGDGPWELMEDFDDGLPSRKFDNFQFVNFTKLSQRAAQRSYTPDKWEADFALNALMEIPDQYAAINKMGMLMSSPHRPVNRVSVLPPAHVVGDGVRPSYPGAQQSLYSSQGAVSTGVPVYSGGKMAYT